MRRLGPMLVLLLAVIAIILAAVAALSHVWNAGHDGTQSAGRRHAVAPALETAPQPVLQHYLAQKESMANDYGWIDSTQNLARIPVDEAMRALATPSGFPPEQRAAYLMGTGAHQ